VGGRGFIGDVLDAHEAANSTITRHLTPYAFDMMQGINTDPSQMSISNTEYLKAK
jgi:hypothetical protein